MRRVRRWQIMGVLLVLLGASFWAAPVPVAAGTDHVTTCATTGAGSLPAIVASATANDTIVFDRDCTGANAIIFTQTISLSKNLVIDATNPSHTVTVDGGCTVGGGGQCMSGGVTVFSVSGGATVTLNGLTIAHGNTSGNGGGIANVNGGSGGSLTVMNSTITTNTATGKGGGIWNGNAGVLTVLDSTIVANGATDSGGGIDNDIQGTLTIANSTITGNTAVSEGAGITISSGSLTVTNSTISGNTVTGGAGGGIFIGGLTHTTNTLVAGNSAASGGPDVEGVGESGGHNLVGKTDDSSGWVASDRTGTVASPLNASIGPLANNGGPTQTIAPQSGSLAIGNGDPTTCATAPVGGHDQRGLLRLRSVCDIGAYQVQTHLLVTTASGTAGALLSLSVAALDDYENFVSAYAGTLHFMSSDAIATLPADYTYSGAGSGHDNGAHSFVAVFRSAGTVTVTATDTQVSTLTGQVTAAIAPDVTAVGPTTGGTAGGNHITLTGLGFGTTPANVTVTIGGNPAPVMSVTNTQVVVTAPAHAAGAVNVVVTANGQATTVTGGYTYGVMTALPEGRPVGGAASSPSPLPAGRTPGGQQGNPNPLPAPRP